MLAAHACLLAYSAARHSPTIHELAHLPAGICHWQFGMFELYRVNPPLPRMVAALPVLFCDPKTDWGNYQLDPLSRETIPMGVRFAKANGERTLFLFMVARWACIPFALLGAWTCYGWAGELWGRRAGLAALCLWCFDPMMLGHGSVVMPDVPAAALGVFAAWRFWKWLRAPSWSAAATAGLALGVAELCKTTLLLFFALWPLAWLMYRFKRAARRQDHRGHHAPRDVPAASGGSITRSVMTTMAVPLQVLLMLVVAVYLINLGYAFRGSCQRLGDYRFQSCLLTGEPTATPPKVGNRLQNTWLAGVRLPLPRDYVQGIDRQRADFEEGLRSYLHGRWSPRGWWYYYLLGFGIKLPLGTLALFAFTAAVFVAELVRVRGPRLALPPGEDRGEGALPQCAPCGRRDELFLLTGGVAIFALVSSQTGFSAHVRYAIPALPFFFIWCGKLFADRPGLCRERTPCRSEVRRERALWRSAARGVAWLCVTAATIESLSVYPHSIAFFNLLIGGPAHAHRWLLDSNGAWGQDLVYLKEWVERHPEARPLHVATVGWLDPAVVGIDYTIPHVGPSHPITDDQRAAQNSPSGRVRVAGAAFDQRSHHAPRDASAVDELDANQVPQTWQEVASLADLGPRPGWYIIDVNFLHGTDWSATRPGWYFQKIANDGLNYEYFRLFEPRGQIAYSYMVYHITAERSAAVRRRLGLPP